MLADAMYSIPLEVGIAATIGQALLVLVTSLGIASWIAARPIRAAAGESWVLQARAAWALQTLYAFAYASSLGVTMAWHHLRRDYPPALSPRAAAGYGFGVVAVVMLWYARRTQRLVHGHTPSWRSVFHSTAFLWIVQWATLPLLYVGMRYCPPQFDRQAATVYVAVLLAALGLQFGGSMWVLRRLRIARPASPAVQAVVDAASARCGFAFPPVDEVDLFVANAWAFQTAGRIGVTRRLAEALEPDELESILLHEVGHMRESRGQIVQRLLVTPVVAGMALMPALLGQYGRNGFLAYFGLLYLTIFWSRRVAHRLELQADAFSAQTVVDPVAYARAMEKIYRLNLVPVVIGRVSPTHPELYDRMLAAGVTPDYPRPPRPSRAFGLFVKLLFLTLLIAGLFASEVLIRIANDPRWYLP